MAPREEERGVGEFAATVARLGAPEPEPSAFELGVEQASRRRGRWSHRGRTPAKPAGDRDGDATRARATKPAPPGIVELQLAGLEATVSDLLETREATAVAAKVLEHAVNAVSADQLLLAVRFSDRGPTEVHARGIGGEEARRLGEELLAAGPAAPDTRPRRLVSEVRSGQRHYGALAAFRVDGASAGEQQLLDAYARLAATAFDACIALEAAATRRQTAEVLGGFAGRLIRVHDTVGVAEATVEAAREIVGSDRAVVFRHCEEDGALRLVSLRGHPPGLDDVLSGLVITDEDTPELRNIFEHPDAARIYERSSVDRYLAAMMDTTGIDAFAAAPIRSNERLFGVLAASWVGGNVPGDLEELGRRLAGITNQAAGAWEKALLIEQVNRQASIDTLTGCANRRVFTETLARLLSRVDAPPLAVVFCDLDRFKGVNDVLGHAAGDELLVAVGRRLQHCVRSDDLVARLGGDEFTVLLSDIGDDWSPEIFAARVREAMTDPVELEDSQVVVHLSLGAVVATPGTTTVKDVLRRADAAMYAAKTRGGDRLLSFEEHMLQERSERLELEASLARATARPEQFVVAYQPQVDLESGRVVSAEALVRWQHPVLGILAPDRFLGVAEETGLIVPIDLHVLRSSLTQLAAWRRAGADVRVAVNFSARTLASPGLEATIEAELALSGVAAELLEIELTESTAVSDTEALGKTLGAIRRLGVTIAIDDVGTGYSSLALLHKLPAERIKIDRSFVQRITDDAASRSVVEAVLLLADRLGQSVVAEGIETEEQARSLTGLGCRLGQGYLFARPGDASDLLRLALAGAAVPSPAA